MRAVLVGIIVLASFAGLRAQGIHWLESELHRGAGRKPGPAFHGTPSPLVPRDEPGVTRKVYGYSTYWTSDE
ncbi:hypothetical protein JXB37_01745, partial [candidate division WOR-3 bacterium]|nr:hypothetical protein [candidate division WOR-3 bacterium]